MHWTVNHLQESVDSCLCSKIVSPILHQPTSFSGPSLFLPEDPRNEVFHWNTKYWDLSVNCAINITRDYFRQRKNAVKKCALIAARHGYKVFGVRRQDLCATGPKAHVTYRMFGVSRRCRNGRGSRGGRTNDVYSVSGKVYLCVWRPSHQGIFFLFSHVSGFVRTFLIYIQMFSKPQNVLQTERTDFALYLWRLAAVANVMKVIRLKLKFTNYAAGEQQK